MILFLKMYSEYVDFHVHDALWNVDSPFIHNSPTMQRKK